MTSTATSRYVGETHGEYESGRSQGPRGGGLVVGRSGAGPVTDDYPGQRPWAFTAGTVKRVVIDVSGEAFVDLARETAAAFARR
jgi:hypothetical protein